MPQLDIRSNLFSVIALEADIGSSQVVQGAIVDTANFDLGFMYQFLNINFTDGDYAFLIEEGDDPTLSDATVVPPEKIIGDLLDITVTSSTLSGQKLQTLGIFSVKKFLRITITATNVNDGVIVRVIATQSGEIVPIDDK